MGKRAEKQAAKYQAQKERTQAAVKAAELKQTGPQYSKDEKPAEKK
jgi:hypothetical protein